MSLCAEDDAEVMQPEEGAEDHPAAANRKELTSETDAACWRLKFAGLSNCSCLQMDFNRTFSGLSKVAH